MWEISRLGGETGAVSLSTVSRHCHIPRNSLAPLALALRNHGLLQAVRGSRGGYRLSRPSRQIPLGEIIEASAGPINIVDCVQAPATCLRSDCCDCRLAYTILNERIRDVLDHVTLGQIQDPAWLWSRTARHTIPAKSGKSKQTFGRVSSIELHQRH